MSQPPYPPTQPNPAYPPTQPQGAYGAGPAPPAYSYQPPPQATNVQVVHVQQQPAKKQGFFGSIMKEVDSLGKTLSKEFDYASNKINEAVDKNWSSNLLDLFKQGNVIQLVSRTSARTVQIVSGPGGQLILDANGPLDPSAFNTLWTVVNVGNNQVHLSNFNNYLAIIDGKTVLVPYGPGSTVGLETKLQLSQIQGQFVTLESVKDRKHHLGFTKAGELRPALATGKEMDAQFGVKLVSTPYPIVQPVPGTRPPHK